MATRAILPGTRVRTRAGIIGAVERVEPLGADQDTPEALLVRADDGTRHYRFPVHLVEGVAQETDHTVSYTVAHLALDPADLGRYAVREDEGQQAAVTQGETLRIPLVAEDLVAETRPVQRGTLRLHRSVETVEQRLTVPVTREEVIVERIPAAQYDASAPANPDETIIPVVEERLVVETRTVIVEYIRVTIRRVTEDQEVRAPLRREVVTIQEVEGAGGVTDRPLGHGAAHADQPDNAATTL